MTSKLNILESDLSKLVGKFLIQVNDDDHEPFVNQSQGFLMEKRISFLTSLNDKEGNWVLSGFYYSHSKPISKETMVEKINKGGKEDRHYRLVTPKELKILFSWMQEELINTF